MATPAISVDPVPDEAGQSDTEPAPPKRERHVTGSVVTKGTRSWDLMYDMLFGIRYTTGRFSSQPERDLTEQDFTYAFKIEIPRGGSAETPAHSQYDFKFKDYCPMVFRALRKKFQIDSAEYMVSLTGDYVLSELLTPGKSGQFFYFSADQRFIIKTVSKEESKFLCSILGHYYHHVLSNPDTLLSRFFGLHRVKPYKGNRIHFVVMGNIFVPERMCTEKYDLKGSTVGRTSVGEDGKSAGVMKDLDFLNRNRRLILGPFKRLCFVEQIKKDSAFLAKHNIMDYSLLVGISYVKPNLPHTRSTFALRPAAERERDRLRATSIGMNKANVDNLTDPVAFEEHHFAERSSVFQADEGGIQATDGSDKPLGVIYYIGIIDFLQEYNVRKKLEHSWKSIQHDKHEISAVDAREYAHRFADFMFTIVDPKTGFLSALVFVMCLSGSG
eukprot:TRINITY_DN918_c0_g1_i3.p1 TRINITY_DN918_c0_g1~~TRINITY_DN918_c0_g1_i3.p1  ORF type:complete len:442 (+),score=90.42 TRINITY_DN918_c0_g1_i3:100-1425(+)